MQLFAAFRALSRLVEEGRAIRGIVPELELLDEVLFDEVELLDEVPLLVVELLPPAPASGMGPIAQSRTRSPGTELRS